MSMLSWGVGRRLAWAAAVSLLCLPVPAALRAWEPLPAEPIADSDGRVQVLVELEDAPAARVYGEVLHDAKLAPAEAKAQAVRLAAAQVRKIAAAQERVAASLPGAASPVEIYRVQKAYNGIALQIDASGVAALRAIPGVRAVRPLELECADQLHERAVPRHAPTSGATRSACPPAPPAPASASESSTPASTTSTPTSAAPACSPTTRRTTAQWRRDALLPEREGGRRLRLRRRRLHRQRPCRRPMPTRWTATATARTSSGTAAGFGVNADGTTFAGPYGPGDAVRVAAHRSRHGAAGAALRPARLRLRRRHRPHRRWPSTGPWTRTATMTCPTTST